MRRLAAAPITNIDCSYITISGNTASKSFNVSLSGSHWLKFLALKISERLPSYLDAQKQHCRLKEKTLNRNRVLELLLQNLKELSLCNSQGGDSKKDLENALRSTPTTQKVNP